jgi:hypothetical protein
MVLDPRFVQAKAGGSRLGDILSALIGAEPSQMLTVRQRQNWVSCRFGRGKHVHCPSRAFRRLI